MCRRGDSAEVIAGTSGRAIPDVEVRIVDGDGDEVPTRAGRARSSCAATTSCPGTSTTPRPPRRPSTAEGGCTPATSASSTRAGNLAITDRLKDMYVSGGFNVYPAEVEAVLRRHPGVAQVAVVGVPDRRMGEVGLAVVVAAPDGDAGRSPRPCRPSPGSSLANFKVPRRVEVVDALPTNASGKVLKRELRERFGS